MQLPKRESLPKRNNPLGKLGEDFAVKFLLQKDYRILARNFRSRFGEIDIVAQKGDALVFVEVKTRWSKKFGGPFEAVTPWKIQKIKRTAEYYSLLHPKLPKKLLIEIVGLEIENAEVVSCKVATLLE